jgi:hypothetical protein
LISVIGRRLGFESPVFPGLDIKLIVFVVFVNWKSVSSEGKYSLSKSSEVRVGLVNFSSKFFSEILLFTVDKDL